MCLLHVLTDERFVSPEKVEVEETSAALVAALVARQQSKYKCTSRLQVYQLPAAHLVIAGRSGRHNAT